MRSNTLHPQERKQTACLAFLPLPAIKQTAEPSTNNSRPYHVSGLLKVSKYNKLFINQIGSRSALVFCIFSIENGCTIQSYPTLSNKVKIKAVYSTWKEI
jgi:hypothetical protein